MDRLKALHDKLDAVLIEAKTNAHKHHIQRQPGTERLTFRHKTETWHVAPL